jgi:hypothetical protein
MPLAPSFRRPLRFLALLLTVPLLVLGLGTAPAAAANVTNTTFRVPADVQINPCFPTDVVNLSGTIHVVISSTTDRSGGVHTTQSLNSKLAGASITTGTRYVNSEKHHSSWYEGGPFPVIHTETYDFVLVSRSNTPNYVLHMTVHTTVTANGRPAAVVDNMHVDCQG